MVRRWLLTAAVVWMSACGGPAETQVRDPEPTPSSTADAVEAPFELRVVVATDQVAAPDSQVLQQFTNLDCDAPAVEAAPEEPTAACDDAGVKYSLEPARIVGGIESASAGIPEGQAAWAVTVDLDHAATRELAEVTAELATTQVRLALVLDGRVVSAPQVESPILEGALQISGDFTEEQARALADRLAG